MKHELTSLFLISECKFYLKNLCSLKIAMRNVQWYEHNKQHILNWSEKITEIKFTKFCNLYTFCYWFSVLWWLKQAQIISE
jgi:hypothetical protein